MKTCFVISPIGADGSDIRKKADDLFDLIIHPALEIFDFKVIRGDKLLTVSAITDDIVNYIQNAELCIIDLTGHNPNVFYECGRRHETARPYIHIKQKGEQIPFDISGIRTIDYDLTDGRKIRESIESLRMFVTELENTGYASQSSTFSLTHLATTLSRIERKIDGLGGGINMAMGNGDADKTDLTGSPYRTYLKALDTGEYEKATIALKKFMKINNDASLHLDLCTYLTDAYEPQAVVLARAIMDKYFDSIKMSIVAISLDSLTRFYSDAMSLDVEYDGLRKYLEAGLALCQNDNDRSSFYNVAASLEYYRKNDIKALEFQKKAVELRVSSPLLYNLAKIYEALDKKGDLMDTLDTYVYHVSNNKDKADKNEITYLDYAKKKYQEAQNQDKVSKIDALVQEIYGK